MPSASSASSSNVPVASGSGAASAHDATNDDAQRGDAQRGDAQRDGSAAADNAASVKGPSAAEGPSAADHPAEKAAPNDETKPDNEALDDDVRRCANCDALLHGRYCSECGQRDAKRMIPLWGMVNELLEEMAELDVRFVRTLPSFFIPGKLTEAYINGRRRQYVRPFRLYLFASFFLFTVIAFQGATEMDSMLNGETTGPSEPEIVLQQGGSLTAPTRARLDSMAAQINVDPDALIDARRLMKAEGLSSERIADIQRAALAQARLQADSAQQALQMVVNDSLGRSIDAPLAPSLNWREDAARDLEDASISVNLPLADDATNQQIASTLKTNGARALRNPKAFVGSLIDKGPYLMFLLLPVFALLLKLVYIRRGRLYAEHFIFTVHMHAFTFVAFACGSLLSDVDAAWMSQVGSWIAVSPFLYIYVAMMRVYKQGILKTGFKAMLVFVIYNIVLGLGFIVLALAAILLF